VSYDGCPHFRLVDGGLLADGFGRAWPGKESFGISSGVLSEQEQEQEQVHFAVATIASQGRRTSFPKAMTVKLVALLPY
jgi:hypothetical protein